MANEIARALRKRLTPQEVKLWVKLREMKAHGFHFRRQAPVGPYVVDFVSFRSKLVVEVDGGQHGMPEGVRSDQLRDATLQSQGFAVRRFWNSDIDANLAGVMESILSALRHPPPDRPSAGHLRASFARLDPTRGRDKKNQFCNRTPTITTVDAVLLPAMLESSQSRRSVPLSHRLRFIL